MLLCLSSLILTSRIEAVSLGVTTSFDKTEYVPSDTGWITVKITNPFNQTITIIAISIKFDWTDEAITIQPTERSIAQGDSNQYQKEFKIPPTIKVGKHACTLQIDYWLGSEWYRTEIQRIIEIQNPIPWIPIIILIIGAGVVIWFLKKRSERVQLTTNL